MRILVCSERSLFGPVNGGRLVLRALLHELAPRHLIRLLCLEPTDETDTEMREVSVRVAGGGAARRNAANLKRDHPGDANWGRLGRQTRSQIEQLARAIARGRPMHVDELACRMRPTLLEELGTFQPDLVQVSAGALAALGRDLTEIPSVLVPLDAEHKNVEAQALEFTGVRRRLLLAEAERMRRYEADDYSRFARVVVTSESDRIALQLANPRMNIDVIPNGVDTGFFSPPEMREGRPTIVFHGVMDFAPNVQAADFLARRVWPLVKRGHRDAELAIVGREPTRKVRALTTIPGVKVTGEVADVRPWLMGGRVYVCPMLTGTGIKNKLLEAMASGIPCIATPTALGGISAVPGRDLLVAHGAREIADQVELLLTDDSLARNLGNAARRYVETSHDWANVARAYEHVYQAAAETRG